MLDESEVIARYIAPLAREFPGAYGLLDDVALISPALGNELVVKLTLSLPASRYRLPTHKGHDDA
jgi:hypothetical protein